MKFCQYLRQHLATIRNNQLDVHERVGQSKHSKAMASYKGKDSTYSKISKRFFWYSIYKDVESYIKSCENYQKQFDFKLRTNRKLHSLVVPSNFMKQVCVDLSGLPEVDRYHYLIVCIE